MNELIQTPAAKRALWLLNSINGRDAWTEETLADNVAPQLAGSIPLKTWVERIAAMTEGYAPLTLVGLDLDAGWAKARVTTRDDVKLLFVCRIEDETTHRISSISVSTLPPAGLTPRLPMDFKDYESPTDHRNADARLIVLSGVPGTGKSSLADAIGAAIKVPVFAIDWLLGAITPFGGHALEKLWDIGIEQLTTLAVRQLTLGQSAILDYPAEDIETRERWRTLAGRFDVPFKAILCICSDEAVHKQRVEGRQRGIPGWHNAGHWGNVQGRLQKFPAWEGEVLTVDSMRPMEDNVAAVLGYLK